MPRDIYRYALSQRIPIAEAVATLELAFIAVESLHGEARKRLDARCAVVPHERTIEVDASTHVGQALNQIFVGFMTREFGTSAFTVARSSVTSVDRSSSA